MPILRFITQPGFTPVVNLKNAAGEAVGSANLATTTVAAGLYTCNVGNLTGIVYVIASQGAFKATGWANLDAPIDGFVEVVDNYQDAVDAGTVDEALIAQKVYQRMANGSVSVLPKPQIGSPIDPIIDVDFKLDISVAVAASSRLTFEMRNCVSDKDPVMKIDSVDGLQLIYGQTSVTAGDASVARVSSTLVRVTIRARSLKLLGVGKRVASLREITTGNETKEPYSIEIRFIQSAGRELAS